MIKPKGAATVTGIILISSCGWAALVHFVLAPNFGAGLIILIAGGIAIGIAIGYLIKRWWFKGI